MVGGRRLKKRLFKFVFFSDLLGVLGNQELGHLAADEVRLLFSSFGFFVLSLGFCEIVRNLLQLLRDLSAD